MTPQERDLITALFARLEAQVKQPQNVERDEEAEALIQSAAAAQPDATYLLVQTVLIQELALRDAEARLAGLERQLAEAKQQAAPKTSFLGSVLGGGSTSGSSVPSAGPWTRSAPQAPSSPPAPVWTQSAPGGSPWQAAPPYAGPAYASGGYARSGAPSFLHQAAMTAAGVAGGALLFQGIQSMFGPHYYGSMFGGMPMQPGLSETIINNNYYNDPAGTGGGIDPNTRFDRDADPGLRDAGYNDPGISDADFTADPGFDGGGGDFGGTDI